ncbi:MAG TPA: hypothetical protein VEI94_13260 [Candidatus Bathyarchaeia archaeon]|nr:hypothetical protein [Candidatus Bathyarchaeia archaeon]
MISIERQLSAAATALNAEAQGALSPATSGASWEAELQQQLANAASATQGSGSDPSQGSGNELFYGIVQGSWQGSSSDQSGATQGWQDFSAQDPAGTPWDRFGFQDAHAPSSSTQTPYDRMPGADPSSSPPGSLGAFDPATGLYDWIHSGSGITMNTPGPGNIGPVGSNGMINGENVVTDARGRTPDQSAAMLALEASDPTLARQVQSDTEYWNPEFRYTPGMSDDEIVAGLTQPYTGGQTAQPGTMYLPYGGSSSNVSDYSAWQPVLSQGSSDSQGASSQAASEVAQALALLPSV